MPLPKLTPEQRAAALEKAAAARKAAREGFAVRVRVRERSGQGKVALDVLQPQSPAGTAERARP